MWKFSPDPGGLFPALNDRDFQELLKNNSMKTVCPDLEVAG